MANRYFAVVKMDDYKKTASTGGVVVDICYWPEREEDRQLPFRSLWDINLKYGPGHKLIPCDENVKPNWIYTDKTHLFVDSNISDN